MRKHRHYPWFHKAHSRSAYNAEALKPPLRRAHGLTPRQPPAPSVLERAEKRRRLYMHAAARVREDLARVAK